MTKTGKKPVKIAVAVVLAAVLVLAAAYAVGFAYWGRNHAVLYDVKSVTVQQTEDGIYEITYDVCAKNWPHDFSEKTYSLRAALAGEPGSYDFDGGSGAFAVGTKPARFAIRVRFDIATVAPYPGMPEGAEALIKEVVLNSCFAAYDEAGNEVPGAALYMQDRPRTEIVFAD